MLTILRFFSVSPNQMPGIYCTPNEAMPLPYATFQTDYQYPIYSIIK